VSEGRDLSLTREQIIGLLAELGQELDARGVKAQLFVVGGAAMALAYNMRRTTADVDGVFEPKAVIYEAARRVAERHEKLPADWLNDGVKGLLPGGADRHAKVILDLPGITVSVPSPHYLLALKVQAARPPAQSPVHRAGDVPQGSGRALATVSTPSHEANNNDAIAVLSDTPIAEALRQAREKAGLSVSMMARSAQTSRAAIHAYETGAREPSVTTALRLLQACGYTMGIIPDRR
jgi:DNA-binding XRE family transcriptional regulator